MSQRVRVSIWLLLSVSLTLPAAAQQKEPVGPFAIDLRFAYGRHKAEPSVATDLGVEPGNLPPRTIGLVGGAHVYPLRSSKISLGVGANAVITRGSRALDITQTGSTTTVKSPTVRRHFTTISPEISLNFGHSHGWSYISGGMFGRSSLYLDRADAPGSNAPYRSTINYGGGGEVVQHRPPRVLCGFSLVLGRRAGRHGQPRGTAADDAALTLGRRQLPLAHSHKP